MKETGLKVDYLAVLPPLCTNHDSLHTHVDHFPKYHSSGKYIVGNFQLKIKKIYPCGKAMKIF